MTTRFQQTASTALALVFLCGSQLVAQVPSEHQTVAKPLAPTPRCIAQIDGPIHPTVAPSPDSRFFAALQTRPDPVLWIVPTDGSDPFAFRKMWAAYNPRWSPAGDRIGFIAAIGPPRIWTVELDPSSGRPIDPPRLLIRTGANAFAFSPDGARIALVASRSTAAGASELHIVDWETREARVLLRESGTVYRLDWAPDGRSIYFGLHPDSPSADPDHQVKVVSVATGSARTIRAAGEFLGLSPDGGSILIRPPQSEQASTNLVQVVELEDASVITVELPAGVRSVGWAANSAAIVLVAPAADKDGIWEIPIKPIEP